MRATDLLDQRHITNALVRVGGKIANIVTLLIEQEYGQHHHFSMELDYDALGNSFMDDPTRQIELIGKMVVVELQHGNDNNNAYIFRGVTTQIKLTGRDGKHGYLVIEGYSPTIMLERGKRMDIYSDITLKNIFKRLTDGVYSDYIKALNEPTYKNKIDFVMQYNETDWEFLRRLSYLYGENLFYSGYEILFGTYEEWEPVKLSYDKEIESIEFCSRMLPNHSVHYQYNPEENTMLEKASPDKIENSNNYLDAVAEQNAALTNDKPAKNITSAPITTRSELDELVKREKVRTAGQTVYIKGRSKSYESTIGRLISVSIPENLGSGRDLGTYRVIKSVHVIDQNHRYYNDFEAVPASLATMPVSKPVMPVAESVIGEVTANDDPKGMGRVQVDFSFANQYNKVWMRVLTPSAGSGDMVTTNRGLVFIPEKGDQVMVGFEQGDPNRPYVMGSLFHGENGAGGGADNAKKSIITRSGHTLEFDDSKDSLGITIKDENGNIIQFDTRAKNIEITAPETITLTANNINVNANENISMISGTNTIIQAGNNLIQAIDNEHQLNADKSINILNDKYSVNAKKIEEAADKVTINSSKEDMDLHSAKKVNVQSSDKINLF